MDLRRGELLTCMERTGVGREDQPMSPGVDPPWTSRRSPICSLLTGNPLPPHPQPDVPAAASTHSRPSITSPRGRQPDPGPCNSERKRFAPRCSARRSSCSAGSMPHSTPRSFRESPRAHADFECRTEIAVPEQANGGQRVSIGNRPFGLSNQPSHRVRAPSKGLRRLVTLLLIAQTVVNEIRESHRDVGSESRSARAASPVSPPGRRPSRPLSPSLISARVGDESPCSGRAAWRDRSASE